MNVTPNAEQTEYDKAPEITVAELITLLKQHEPGQKLEKVDVVTNRARGFAMVRLHFSNGAYTGVRTPIFEAIDYNS